MTSSNSKSMPGVGDLIIFSNEKSYHSGSYGMIVKKMLILPAWPKSRPLYRIIFNNTSIDCNSNYFKVIDKAQYSDN